MKKISKEKFTSDRGITLVALVVTIVVLLILAGISLNLVFGQNGIITRAQEARDKTAEDQLKTGKAVNGLAGEIDGFLDGTNSGDLPSTEGAIITDYGTAVASATAKDLIGAEVTNYNDYCNDGEESGWQVLYVGTEPGGTEERIYLISKDNIKIENCPEDQNGMPLARVTVKNEKKLAEIEGITKLASIEKTIIDKNVVSKIKIASNSGSESGSGSSNYYEYSTERGFANVFYNYSGSEFINSTSKAKKWISWTKNYDNSTATNIKSVAYMLDTNVWTRKYTDNNFADYVIGGPTLELLLASWNTKYPENKMYCNGNGNDKQYGYYIGNSSGANTYINDTYVSGDVFTESRKAGAYWIASPSASDYYHGDAIMCMHRDGLLTFSEYRENCGIRPVVCLSSGVRLENNGDGTYRLEK